MTKTYFNIKPPVSFFDRERFIEDLFTYVYYEKIVSELEKTGSGKIKESKDLYAHRIVSNISALAPDTASAEELAEKLKNAL